MNCCSATELRSKEVISAKSGMRLGCVSDVEINTCDGRLTAIIIWGRGRCFGLFGREDDIRIPWEEIEVIGNDTILVCTEPGINSQKPPKKGLLDGLFRY